jgi:putative ABC transport system permease protein
MTTKDIIEETYTALSANKIRSGLTMLGIIIGISSVIALVAIGNGASASIQSSIQSIGANLIEVIPGAQNGPGYQISVGRGTARSLTQDDAAAISTQVANITAVAPELSGRYQVTASGTNTNTSVDGVTPTYPQVRNVVLDQGSFITQQNITDISKVAVLGPTTMQDLFGTTAVESQVIGQTIVVKGVEFTVIGVMQSKGSTGAGSSQDDMIYVPISTAVQYLAGATNNYLTTIDVEATNSSVMTQVQNDITSLLLTRHNISDPTKADFSTLNEASIVATASSVTGTFTILLGAVAGISLLVGGIGIMNMMLTTVTERTREIGLRKAIGAKRRDINIQFLIEAIALTFTGGLIGVILGWSIAAMLTYLKIITTNVTISSVLLAFGVSAVIGIVFGYYPARRASSLNPIEALRYE